MNHISQARSARRRWLSALGTVAGIALVAGCSSGQPSTAGGGFAQPDGDVPAAFEGRQRVVFWSTFTDTNGAALQELADQFNESQDDTYVEVQFQGGYSDTRQKLVAGILAKQVPDIFISSGEWTTLYLSDALAPLDEYVDIDLYDRAFLPEGQTNGQTYWVPFARSTPLFYYNKDMYAAAGLPDRGPETWSELAEWGESFQGVKASDGSDATLYGLSSQDKDWQFMGMAWNFGGEFSDGLTPTMTDSGVVAAAEYTQDLIKAGTARVATNIVTDFQNGLVASAAMSTASLRGLLDLVDFELGAAYMPGEKVDAVAGGGGGLAIPAGVPEERRKAAAEFINFLAQPAQAAEWSARTGYIISNPAGAQEQAYTDAVANNPLFDLARQQTANLLPNAPMRRWIPASGETIWASVQRIWIDGVDPAEEFAKTDVTLQRAVGEFELVHADLTID